MKTLRKIIVTAALLIGVVFIANAQNFSNDVKQNTQQSYWAEIESVIDFLNPGHLLAKYIVCKCKKNHHAEAWHQKQDLTNTKLKRKLNRNEYFSKANTRPVHNPDKSKQ